jgi:hypothetical protein
MKVSTDLGAAKFVKIRGHTGLSENGLQNIPQIQVRIPKFSIFCSNYQQNKPIWR